MGAEDELDASIATSDKVIKRKGRTLLTDKSARPRKQGQNNITLDKIPEKSFKNAAAST